MRPRPDIHFYLPVNDDAMRWGIYLTGVGRAVVPRGSRYPPYRHPRLYDFRWEEGRTLPEFQVVLISEGRGVFESKTTGRLVVPPRSVFFLFPGVWHRYRPAEESGWTERWIAFNGELAHRLMDMSLLQRDCPIRGVTDLAALARGYDDLIEKVVAHPARNSILLSLHALGLLGTAIEAVGVDLPSAMKPSVRRESVADEVVSRALEWLWTRGHQAISVEQIAEAVGVTRRTLERRFQQSLGHSIVGEIISCRVNRAKRLLEETELPVKTVSYLAGFPSEQRMRAAFVERERVSPITFRRRARRTEPRP